ncbi:Mitochondrial distribution and morphology protein 35 [Naganishia albida]|nr:Mitochondrial distribution and morphology protein 35 [Naganishia albida]
MDSLSQECTASKHRYDQCFNAWFEGYLKPIVAAQTGDISADLIEEEEEEECPEDEDPFEEEAELLAQDESETPLADSVSSGVGPSTHHHHHHTQHHPSWSLRNDDRHPDLWPWSRSGNARASSTRTTKTAVAQATPSSVTSEEAPLSAATQQSDLPTRKTDTQPSNQHVAAAIPLTTSSPVEQRAEWARAKKEEYDRNCGALWTDYRECLQRAIDANHPLSALLEQARLENPIEDAEAYEDGGYGAPDAQP